MRSIAGIALMLFLAPLFTEAAGISLPESAAFDRLADVLLHPRCLNCHTAVDYPKQGDDRHRHAFGVVRGVDDRGAAALRCSTCHQSVNNAASGVPGAPSWQAAPGTMAWENLSRAKLCRTLLDPKKNGGRSLAQIVEHLSNDKLVAWGWSPGGARQPVPIAKEEFISIVKEWQAEGAPCPR